MQHNLSGLCLSSLSGTEEFLGVSCLDVVVGSAVLEFSIRQVAGLS